MMQDLGSTMLRGSVWVEQAQALRWVLSHPLNKGHAGKAFLRWLFWHLRGAFSPRGATTFLPFVADTRLIGGRALTTANVQHYVGLGELDVMGFLLHALRPEDLLVDVGANVGAVTVMAAGIGAEVIAVEPLPETFGWLRRNIDLNRLGHRVDARNMAVGEQTATLRLSSGQGASNHVELGASADAIECPCDTLDSIVGERRVSVVKIDVEGFEVPVVRGGAAVWSQPSLRAIVAELKDHGSRYGFDENEAIDVFGRHGFEPCVYDALARRLTPLNIAAERPDNLIFVRDREAMQASLAEAPLRRIIWDRRI